MARRSIYNTRASDWIGSVLADDGRAMGAGSGLFVSERIGLDWLDAVTALVDTAAAKLSPTFYYDVDALPLVDGAPGAARVTLVKMAADSNGIATRPTAAAEMSPSGEDLAAMADGTDMSASGDLTLAGKAATLSEVAPRTGFDRLVETAAGDLRSIDIVDIMGSSFVTPGADPFGLTSFMLIDADGDGLDDFVIRLDATGPVLLGTDFLI